jgi:hypothetical protein
VQNFGVSRQAPNMLENRLPRTTLVSDQLGAAKGPAGRHDQALQALESAKPLI